MGAAAATPATIATGRHAPMALRGATAARARPRATTPAQVQEQICSFLLLNLRWSEPSPSCTDSSFLHPPVASRINCFSDTPILGLDLVHSMQACRGRGCRTMAARPAAQPAAPPSAPPRCPLAWNGWSKMWLHPQTSFTRPSSHPDTASRHYRGFTTACLDVKMDQNSPAINACSSAMHPHMQATVGTASYAAASDLDSILDIADEEQLDARPTPEVLHMPVPPHSARISSCIAGLGSSHSPARFAAAQAAAASASARMS